MSDTDTAPPPGYRALTEREKQTLRLMLRGHDAKSLARHLGLSVHTINERLREARRKLAVSSSREAARMLLEVEGAAPEKLGDMGFGEAAPAGAMTQAASPEPHRSSHRAAWLLGGGIVMSIVLGILALSWVAPQEPAATVASAQTSATVQSSEAASAAEAWLALSDAGRWEEGWRTAAGSFRAANTVARWAAAARQVRVPLGALVSRTLMSQESVPAPPAGVEVVKFRTRFANRAEAVETVSLAREDGAWKVVGIYLD